MKRGLNICCGVLALALLFGGCAQSVPQQEQEPKAEPVAAEVFAAEVEPEYVLHTAYMSAPKGFFGPDQPLRRAEAAQLVCNLAALSPKNLPESGFADVSPEAWYYGAVCAAAAYFEVPEPVSKPEAEAAGELNEVGAEDPDAPQEEPEPSYFRPQDAALAYELQAALTRALDLPDTALPAGMTDMTVLTRADAAVLVNRLLGRTPDRDALDAVSYDLLLDMPRTDARYAEALEAVFPHEYLESAGERWNLRALEISPMRTGAHTKDGRGFVVDESGCVVRENGLFTSGGWTYLSDTDTGCIFADGALHRTDGHVVLSLRGGQLLQDGAQGEYLFDENGYGHVYTLLVVIFGFVLFRAESLPQALMLLRTMLSGFTPVDACRLALRNLLTAGTVFWCLAGVLACLPLWEHAKARFDGSRWFSPALDALTIVGLLLCLMQLASHSFQPFIYASF